MKEIKKLNARNLSILSEEVAIPSYNRSRLKTGIIHVGVEGFHRAHEAFYVDELLKNHRVTDWAICGVGLMEPDKKTENSLKSQDYLYTLMILHPDGRVTSRVIGSIIEYIYAPENQDIQWDLKNPDRPKTIFGFLSESLRRRAERGLPAFTILDLYQKGVIASIEERNSQQNNSLKIKQIHINFDQNTSN